MVDDALMEKVQKYNDKDDKGEAKNFMDKLQEEVYLFHNKLSQQIINLFNS